MFVFLAVASLIGEAKLATASVNGQQIDTKSPKVKADLKNKTSSLYTSLVREYEPKVRKAHFQIKLSFLIHVNRL